MIENARELLLQPGQFCHDRTAGRLLYLPRPEEQGRAARLTAYAPGLVMLARVAGAAGAMVTNLTLAHAAVDFFGFFAGDGNGQPSRDQPAVGGRRGGADDTPTPRCCLLQRERWVLAEPHLIKPK